MSWDYTWHTHARLQRKRSTSHCLRIIGRKNFLIMTQTICHRLVLLSSFHKRRYNRERASNEGEEKVFLSSPAPQHSLATLFAPLRALPKGKSVILTRSLYISARTRILTLRTWDSHERSWAPKRMFFIGLFPSVYWKCNKTPQKRARVMFVIAGVALSLSVEYKML